MKKKVERMKKFFCGYPNLNPRPAHPLLAFTFSNSPLNPFPTLYVYPQLDLNLLDLNKLTENSCSLFCLRAISKWLLMDVRSKTEKKNNKFGSCKMRNVAQCEGLATIFIQQYVDWLLFTTNFHLIASKTLMKFRRNSSVHWIFSPLGNFLQISGEVMKNQKCFHCCFLIDGDLSIFTVSQCIEKIEEMPKKAKVRNFCWYVFCSYMTANLIKNSISTISSRIPLIKNNKKQQSIQMKKKIRSIFPLFYRMGKKFSIQFFLQRFIV